MLCSLKAYGNLEKLSQRSEYMLNSSKNPGAFPAIPIWLKTLATFCVVSWWGLLGRAVYLPQQSYFGIPHTIFLPVLGSLALFASLPLFLTWYFPKGKLVTGFYWLFQALRELIILLTLYGLLYYIIKLPLFYIKGGGIHINTTLLFSSSGSVPLLNIFCILIMAFFVQPTDQTKFPFQALERLSKLKKDLSEKLDLLPSWGLSLLIALLPVVFVCAIIYLGFGAKLSDYRPYAWNDATSYWMWVRDFSYYGFNVGYNVPGELTAPASFNHFGEGSPFYIYFYGAIGWLVGWSPQLPILINFGLLALALYWFTWSMKFDSWQILLTGLAILSFWPILVYLPTSSQETLNQAIGIGLAAIFFQLFSKKAIKPYIKVLFVFCLFIAALVRLSWTLWFFPLLFLCVDGGLVKKLTISIIVGTILFISVIGITKYLVPPVQNSMFLVLGQAMIQGPRAVISYFFDQTKYMLRVDQITPSIAIVFELLIILGFSAWQLWKLIKKKLPFKLILQSPPAFDTYNVITLLSAGMLFYLVDGFPRAFIPPLLVLALLQIAQKKYKLVNAILVLNILFSPSVINYQGDNYFGNLKSWRIDYTAQHPEIPRLQTAFKELMAFDHKTDNSWCNTVLVPLDYYDYRVTTFPPGIGISYFINLPVRQAHLKSKYLLFDQKTFEIITQNENLHTELLASLPVGNLYYNLDSGCELRR
jgi:hypothetical protein